MTTAVAPPVSPTANQGGGIVSVYGQSVKGKFIKSPWVGDVAYEITQGYGPTDQVYPTDHGTVNWHSGVDVGCPPNTLITMPSDLLATAVLPPFNVGGYGNYIILQMYSQVTLGGANVATQRHYDIYFGHLTTRLVKDGQAVRPGDHIGLTGCTGRCTGPHVHFEVRPPDGKYGTDIDPSNYLLSGTAAGDPQSVGNALGQLDPLGIKAAEQAFARTMIGLGQTALGGGMMLTGGVMVGMGLRGMSGRQAARVTSGTFRKLNRPRAEPQQAQQGAQRPRTAAERTRLRQSLRREVGAPAGLSGAAPPLSSLSGPISAAEERANLRAEMAATGQRAQPGAAIRARARYATTRRVKLVA